MAKDLEMGYLLDFYGEVLTQKQREMLRLLQVLARKILMMPRSV